MSALLWRSSLRHFSRHPLQLALAVLGVALGVAVTVGVDLAVASARVAFRLSTETAQGRATDELVGGPAGLPEGWYRQLRVDRGIRDAAPVVEGFVRVGGRTFHLLGVDPFAESPLRSTLGPVDPSFDFAALLTRPGSVVLSRRTAADLSLVQDDTFTLTVAGYDRSVVLAGVLAPEGEASSRALDAVLLADIGTAQQLLGKVGVLDRIDLYFPDDASGQRERARLVAVLPPGARLLRAGPRTASLVGMTRAFDLNLTALGLLALVFGMFLIYNSMTFSVVQRRRLIGLLRSQGVTTREILALILWEALLLGLVATSLGLVLGVLLGRGLVQLVGRTINDLYFVLSIRGVTLTTAALGRGAVLGVMATLAASLPPAREAAAVPAGTALQRSTLESGARRRTGRAVEWALPLLGSGLLLLAMTHRSLLASFVALFALVLGAALAVPAATVLLMRLLRRPAGRVFGLSGRMAVRGVVRALSRTGPAVAALAVAVSVGVAVGVMIRSFRSTVAGWLQHTLQADIYVAAPAVSATRPTALLAPTVIRQVRTQTGVAGVTTYRNVTLPLETGDVRLVAVDLFPRHRRAFRFRHTLMGGPWPAFDTAGAVLISEAFAFHQRLGVGDSLSLPTRLGPHGFPIAGVFYDYGAEHGVVFMSRHTYDRYWADKGVTSLGVFAAPGTDPDVLLRRLQALDTGGQEVIFRSNRRLREASLQVFDRTFAITAVLRVLAIVVAFVGVLSALLALQLDRARELGVLRALGITPGQLRWLVFSETGLMGLAAGLFALPLGVGLAWVMIYVVNRRSFGWTIHLRLAAGELMVALVLTVAAALLAGLYPSYRMARTRPAVALREE